MIMSSNFVVKSYKRANIDDWPQFEKGKDIRVQIQWKKESIYEFIVENAFWNMRNTNKDDRNHMRRWADQKIQMFKKSLIKKKKNDIST